MVRKYAKELKEQAWAPLRFIIRILSFVIHSRLRISSFEFPHPGLNAVYTTPGTSSD